MTPQEIALVQSSFRKIVPMPAAFVFYDRLFVLDPALKSLFTGHLETQAGRFIDMVGMLVQSLDRPESLLPALRDLAIRHLDYGVEPPHYETVSKALLWTLEHALGASYTAEVRAAWEAFVELLASTMIEAAYGETV